MAECRDSNNLIEVINIIDVVLIGIMISDLITKCLNQSMVIKANFSDNQMKESYIYFDEPLTFDLYKNDGGLYLIKTSYLIMDAILVVAVIILYAIQVSLASSEKLNYLHVGILMMTRGLFKLPFAIIIIQFMLKINQIKTL